MRSVVVVAWGLAACGPDVGPLVASRCINEDSDPDVDISFRGDLQPIFRGLDGPAGCSCHLPNTPDPIGFDLTGLDLSSYETLRQGGITSGPDIVVPGQPCRSILFLKTGPSPPFGSRMPFDGPPVLDAIRRAKLADWIAEGADND